tara:strand:- start:15722 stop:16837 length:1116 start_codon:yes stop_codon:yes gene_type:complete
MDTGQESKDSEHIIDVQKVEQKEEQKTEDNKLNPQPEKQNSSKKILMISVLALLLLSIVAFGSYQIGKNSNSADNGNEVGDNIGSKTTASKVILATVNGVEITQTEVDKAFDIMLFSQGLPETAKQQIPQSVILNQTITEKLLFQEAEKKNIEVSSMEAEQQITQSLQLSGATIDDFKNQITLQPFTYEEFISSVQKQSIIQKYLSEEVIGDVKLEEGEAEQYYNNNPELFVSGDEIKASHILVETLDEANELITKIEEGEDFAELAQEFSTGPSGPQGGDLGFFGKGRMVPEFEVAAFALEEIDDFTKEPVQTQFGFHVIQLTGKKEAGTLVFEEVKDQLELQLLQVSQQEAVGDFIGKLIESADIELVD